MNGARDELDAGRRKFDGGMEQSRIEGALAQAARYAEYLHHIPLFISGGDIYGSRLFVKG
jgi:hypothetical protein